MRVLDIGCGPGKELSHVGVSESDQIVGLDVLAMNGASRRFPKRRFVQGHAERLPFRDDGFDSVVSLLALPYTDIPRTLAEAHRTLVPGGNLIATFHPFHFTWHELVDEAWPKPKAVLFRLCVMANGIVFHFRGKPLHLAGRYESFQTERGVRLALRRAGFTEIAFSRPEGRLGPRIRVTAKKPRT
jgi:ubiquinone/menaquinone biosynthesis C-methylase UbiE